MKKLTDKQLFEKYGWTEVCSSPFELQHEDGSFARGQAAWLVYRDLQEEERTKTIELTVDEIKTLIQDAGPGQIGWSDSSYRIIEFIGGDPTEGF
jgi:hypothetical protein